MNLINNKIMAFCYICSIILINSCGPDNEKRLSESFRGIVMKKWETRPCFGAILISHDKIIDTPEVCICSQATGNVWDYIMIGDSLSKKAGSLTWHVVRKDIDKEFDYPNCFK